MTTYVALLRAVNVGGTGKLAMSELKALCEQAGFEQVRTYIASGNVIFRSECPAVRVKAVLQASLQAHVGRPVGVLVRTGAEMAAVLAENPFPEAQPHRTLAIFLDEPPPADALDTMTGQNAEEIRLGRREFYVHYGEGMASSRLKIPSAKTGTARNMNTVAKLVELAAAR